MKLRIAIWAVAGAIAVLSWSLCFMATPANNLGSLWILVYFTCPITSLVRSYHHSNSMYNSMYSVLVVNTATYALVGTAVEILRRHSKHSHLISN
jgi:hypothetical protein